MALPNGPKDKMAAWVKEILPDTESCLAEELAEQTSSSD